MFYYHYLLFLIYSLMITANHLMIIVVLRGLFPYYLFIPKNCYVFNFMKMVDYVFTKNRHFIVLRMKCAILFHCKNETISKYLISLPKEYRNNSVSNLCHIFFAKRYKEALMHRYEYMQIIVFCWLYCAFQLSFWAVFRFLQKCSILDHCYNYHYIPHI